MRAAGGLLAVVAGLGCAGSGGLRVKRIDAAAQTPANVAVYFSVETKVGQAVADLTPASFKIYEDGKLVPERKAKRALLDPKMAEARFTIILVDLSGPLVDSEYLPDLVSRVAHLADAAAHGGEVAIDVFDGESELVPMLGFGAARSREVLDSMRRFRPRNRTPDLHGAIQQGVVALRPHLDGASAAHHYGTVVVFTDRGDRAHKSKPEALRKFLDEAGIALQVIAVGEEVDAAGLTALAPAELFVSKDPKDLAKGFTEATRKMEAASSSHYLLSYCSPKREGEHKVEIEVRTPGEGEHDSGRLEFRFRADGFTSGCSPKQRPEFGAAK